jgi:PilZ domain-containing protein
MEHRWGTRKPVSLPVRLKTASGVAAVGTLRDISVSGAFVATAAFISLHEQIELRVYAGPQCRLLLGAFDAHIVRRDGGVGIGVEWSELAPQSLALLEEYSLLEAGPVVIERVEQTYLDRSRAAPSAEPEILRRRRSRSR